MGGPSPGPWWLCVGAVSPGTARHANRHQRTKNNRMDGCACLQTHKHTHMMGRSRRGPAVPTRNPEQRLTRDAAASRPRPRLQPTPTASQTHPGAGVWAWGTTHTCMRSPGRPPPQVLLGLAPAACRSAQGPQGTTPCHAMPASHWPPAPRRITSTGMPPFLLVLLLLVLLLV